MPLHHTLDPAEPTALKDLREDFVIFYASRDASGQLWCSDCLAVEDLVQKAFQPLESPSGLIVYVGQKPEWKSQTNPFRNEPWRIESVPTIIRLRDDARLVDTEIQHRLASFLQE